MTLPVSQTRDPLWTFVNEGVNLAREHEIESLFTVSNGYVGTRGSLEEGIARSSPATLVAGVFQRIEEPWAGPGLAVVPDWLRLRIGFDGDELSLEIGTVLEHRRILDLRQGILWRSWRHRDPRGRVTRVRSLRLASIAERHVLVHIAEITPENHSGRLFVEPRMEPPVWRTAPVGGAGPLIGTGSASGDLPGHSNATGRSQSPDRIAVAVGSKPTGTLHTALDWRAGEPPEAALGVFEFRPFEADQVVAMGMTAAVRAGERGDEASTATTVRGDRWEIDTTIGASYRFDRIVALHTTRDADDPTAEALAHLERLRGEGIRPVLERHVAAWRERWDAADIRIEGDDEAQRAIRFACYHLIGAANPEDEHVSTAARLLTGEAYRGHVFWDTEIYMLPFYLLTHPPTARALLMYRYHTLDAAREKARGLGLKGAFYAWESADTGVETTPARISTPRETIEIVNGRQACHISAAVAHGVWQYWCATGDAAFLREAGAEILFETARFWASRVESDQEGVYHIREVIGPDEYHPGVDDNAYTNLMARWNLERAVETARLLRDRWPDSWRALANRLELADRELRSWGSIASALYDGFDPETGLYAQFRGYFDLEDVDLTHYEPRTAPMDLLLGRDRIQGTRVIKQADVGLLLHLLEDHIPRWARVQNFRFYERRCGHGSSLSPGVHALVAARLGETELAMRYFRETAAIDLADNMGNASLGVHGAALGSLWQAIVFGFGGLRINHERVSLDPNLPDEWSTLAFPVRWRGFRMRFRLEADAVEVEVDEEPETGIAAGGAAEAAVPFALFGGAADFLQSGRMYRFAREGVGWTASESRAS